MQLCADKVVSCVAIAISCADTVPHCNRKYTCNFQVVPILTPISCLYSYFLLVKEEHVVRGNSVEYHPMLLDVAPMERVAGWTLEGEDPKLYTPDQLWKGGRREWPDIPFPTPTAPQGARPKEVPQPEPEEEEELQARGPFHRSDPQMKDLLEIHHSLVKLLKTMGVDACKDYQSTRLQSILENIQSTDLECRVCGKVYKTAAKMKRHFRKRHIGITKYQCNQCQKYYTDAGSLKTHMASHDASKNPFSCKKCSKTFPTKGQLGQHIPSHDDKGKFVCKFAGCGKKFKWKKGKKEHQAKCDFNPDVADQPPHKCPGEGCPKGYWDHRSLLRHYETHPSHKLSG